MSDPEARGQLNPLDGHEDSQGCDSDEALESFELERQVRLSGKLKAAAISVFILQPKSITDGLALNVMIGFAIMIVILAVGTAMLYAVQKILVRWDRFTYICCPCHSSNFDQCSSSQHNAAHFRQQQQKALEGRNFLRKIVHPKDLSAYLANHEFKPNTRKIRRRMTTTTEQPLTSTTNQTWHESI